MAAKPQTARYHQFKQLLHKIATRLGEADVRSLVFNQDLPEELKDALGVLQKLEREGLFSDRNIRPLADLLQAIERHDLVNNFVQEYIQKFGREFEEEEEKTDGNCNKQRALMAAWSINELVLVCSVTDTLSPNTGRFSWVSHTAIRGSG